MLFRQVSECPYEQHAMAHQSPQVVAVVGQAIGASMSKHALQSTSCRQASVAAAHSSAP